MWEVDCQKSWAPKNWCFWTMVVEKTLESPLDCKEIQPVHSEGDQPWVFFGRTDAKAETPVLWPFHAKSWLVGKDSDAGRDWGQEEKGTTEDKMWMASLTQWTWVWVNSRSWWWTGRPDMLRLMRLQRVGHDWATELNWPELKRIIIFATGFPVMKKIESVSDSVVSDSASLWTVAHQAPLSMAFSRQERWSV